MAGGSEFMSYDEVASLASEFVDAIHEKPALKITQPRRSLGAAVKRDERGAMTEMSIPDEVVMGFVAAYLTLRLVMWILPSEAKR